MTNLSPHFTLEDMTRSQAAVRKCIDNTPGTVELAALKTLCAGCLEHIREVVGKPIIVDSGYRNPAVNAAVGGTSNPISQHTKGEAADIIVYGMDVETLFQLIKKNIAFDELIQEFGQWVHVSFKETGRRQKSMRSRHDENGDTIYEAY